LNLILFHASLNVLNLKKKKKFLRCMGTGETFNFYTLRMRFYRRIEKERK